MSTSPLPSTLLESNKDEDCNKMFEDLIQILPKVKGWDCQHLYNYKGFWMNAKIVKNNLLLNTHFIPQPSDIVLASSMKSGTTWLKALIFATINRHRYTLSDHHLLHHNPHNSVPFLEVVGYGFSELNRVPPPRLLSTHFARSLLPPRMTSTCKFVYICRDPKDVFVSTWHFLSKLRSKDLPPLSMDEAFELFCNGVIDFGPIWENALSYWKASLETPDKVLFLKYEDMKKKPVLEVRKLATFMGTPFTMEEEQKGVVEDIVRLCSFENLSSLEVNKNGVEKLGNVMEVKNREFFRKGEIGDWKNYLNKEMKERIDGITNEKLKGSGLTLGDASV